MRFPTTPTRDLFSRADENPLDVSGIWSAPIASSGTYNGQFKLAGGALMDDSLADALGFSTAYLDQDFGPGCEAWCQVQTPWQNNASAFALWFCGRNENTGTVSGYRMTVGYNTGVWYVNCYRDDSGVETEIGPSFEAGPTLASGDWIGVRHDGISRIEPWYCPSGGSWQPMPGISNRFDGTYRAGHIGLAKGYQDVTTSISVFGGGTYAPDRLVDWSQFPKPKLRRAA